MIRQRLLTIGIGVCKSGKSGTSGIDAGSTTAQFPVMPRSDVGLSGGAILGRASFSGSWI